ncbi:DUF5659 domain-containing protein [Patescibacteria group bacterium]
MKYQNKYFESNSLALATAIVASSVASLSHIEWNSNKATFVFKRSPNLDKLISLFWQKKLPIDALSYFESLKYLKSRLYEQKYSCGLERG